MGERLRIYSPVNLLKKLLFRYAPPEILPLIKYLRSSGNYYSRNIAVVNTLPPKPILILSPHQDDEAIGMGGALSMHLKGQSKVTIIYMTDGRHTIAPDGLSEMEVVNLRRREAESIAVQYQVNQIFWQVEDGRLTNDDETIAEMIKILRDIRPNIIYLPSFFDYHHDHFAANRILVEALKKASISQITIMGYEVADNIPYPNLIVDISAYFDKKVDLLNHYNSQVNIYNYCNLCKYRNTLHYARYINAMITGYAEAFCCFNSLTYQILFNDYFYFYSSHNDESRLPVNIKL